VARGFDACKRGSSVTRRQRRRLLITTAILLSVSTLLSLLYLRGQLDVFQRQLTDVFFRTKADTPDAAKNLVLVAIDDKSMIELKAYHRFFSWPRTLHAQVVRQLTDARARTIVFDVLFDIPGEGDEDFAAAIDEAEGRATYVVLATAADLLGGRGRGDNGWDSYNELLEPWPPFKAVAHGFGMADQMPDADGTIRRMPLVFNVNGEPYPGLPLTALSSYQRRLAPWDEPIANGLIKIAGREIPIDSRGAVIVNYRGGPYRTSAAPAFPTVSFVDVLYGRVPPETFRAKIALIGVTATGFADDYWTPPSTGSKMSGVEIQANAIDTIFRGEYLYDAPNWLTISLIFGFAIVAGVSLMALPMLLAALVSLAALVGFAIAANVGFDGGGVMLNLIYPPMSLFITYAAVVGYRVIFEQGQTRALRGVLGQYLSPSIVAEVTRDPEQLKLGGDEREMTVMFSDLRGFTTFSETIDPATLVHLLNEYLTVMSDIIFKYQGTIDKYMGDAIMAFWGAPQHQPDHASLACRAALEMVAELEQLNAKWADEGRIPLAMGIGINTGSMKVGNMGSSSRFDYTVLGDAVNLGSRLEGLNKEYGTTLIVSKATLDQTDGSFHPRFLDLVAVKGKREPVEVFEILDAERLPGLQSEPSLRAYDEGIVLYRKRDWLGAAAKFQEALRLVPADGPSAVYLKRCEDLMQDPPAPDWDGVYVMTRK
jgi:adenylate cyclase